MNVAYIDAYKRDFGVEPICRVLRDHDLPIAPSTYYAFKTRSRCARSRSDERLLPIVKLVHAVNYSVYACARCGTPCGASVRTWAVIRWRA